MTRSRFAAAEAYYARSPEEKARIAEEVDASEEFEELAESTISRREDTKAEVEEFYAQTGGEGDLWTRPIDELARVLKTWLTVKVEGTRPRNANDDVIKYATLKAWRMALTRIVSKYVPEGQKHLNDTLYASLMKHTGALTIKHNIQFLQDRKDYCGRDEIRLMTESNYANARNREWTLQCDVIAKLCFSVGYRPGSIGPACDRYLQEGRYLKWRAITITCPSFTDYHTRLENTALKGYNLINAKRLTSNVRSAQRPENVVFELAPPLLCLAIERGGIKHIKDADALLNWKGVKIEWEDWFLDEPVILAGKRGGYPGCEPGVPMRSAGVTDALQVIGKRLGIDLTVYDFRRNFGDKIDKNYGESGAKTGLVHTTTKTYKSSYGREAANLDASGAVMGENLVGREELNAFEAPAMRPGVGLSPTDVKKLEAIQHQSYKVNAAPAHLKRKVEPLIVPYAPMATPASKLVFDDATCEAHPLWIAFTQESQWPTRAKKISELNTTVQTALAKLPSARASTSIDQRLKKGYPNDPELLAAHLEHKRLTGIHQSARNKKLASIRSLLAAANKDTEQPESLAHEYDTQEARASRLAQFAEPSILIDLALQHAPSSKVESKSTSGGSSPSAASVDETLAHKEDMAIDETPAAPPAINLDEMIDPTFEELDEGDVSKMDIDEVPVSVVRAGYIRMISSCGGDNRSTCPKCQIDPTVDEEDQTKEWTQWYLERHMAQFHTPAAQWSRWYNKHKACFLCALDGEVVIFGSRSSFTRHMNKVTGKHSDDPRMPQDAPKIEIPVVLPASFLSADRIIEQEALWLDAMERVTLPPTLLSDGEMREVVEGAQISTVTSLAVAEPINNREVTLRFKRLRLSKESFVFVGSPREQ